MRRKYRKESMIPFLIVFLLFISIGYASLNTDLSIVGNANIKNAKWDIHFENIQIKSGSVSLGAEDKEPTIVDDTHVSYIVSLNKPGDFYEFTVDVVNNGTIRGMISLVSSKMNDVEITTLPAYLNYSVAYSDGVSIKQYQELNAGEKETIKLRVEYRTDIDPSALPGTAQSISFNFGVTYVQADENAEKVAHPVSFAEDDWSTIIAALKSGNTSAYGEDDTKEVDLGTLGKHKIRIANTTTPAECSAEGFSQTACGIVLEFADVITTHRMNPYDQSGNVNGDGNRGGWEYSEMRTYVNNDIYNALPQELKDAIIETKVVSGHGSLDTTNFTTTDKLYLLSPMEVWGLNSYSRYDSARDLSRQLDYYKGKGVTNSNYAAAIKKYNNSNTSWWLRAADSTSYNGFHYVYSSGSWYNGDSTSSNGVSPAFRIG